METKVEVRKKTLYDRVTTGWAEPLDVGKKTMRHPVEDRVRKKEEKKKEKKKEKKNRRAIRLYSFTSTDVDLRVCVCVCVCVCVVCVLSCAGFV